MTLEQRIRKLVELADPDGTVTIRWLAELIDDPDGPVGEGEQQEDDLMDLSVSDLMAATGRARSTVIGWISSGELNAYMFGNERRITKAAWEAFLQARRNRKDQEGRPRPSSAAADLGSWRDVRSGRK